ncbi:MAG: ferrochelatase, partial [Acidiferrobacteraceae bacterium]|nr:ferrochelatase [Acidiferrobacteraceae bacterium]
MRYQRGLLHGATERIGILLVNLGTPNAPTATAVRHYLAEFLHDHRVVELSRWLWCPLLHGGILRLRPQRSAAAYQKIWRDDGSPLMALSRRIAEELDELLRNRHGDAVKVALAMRYGQPSIDATLNELVAAGVERIVVLPLYPQFSCSTTASVYDAVTRTLGKWRNLPALHLVRDYHLDEGYLDALTA